MTEKRKIKVTTVCENIRMKVRDAIEEFLGDTTKAHITQDMMETDFICGLSDAVFNALGISENDQDRYGAEIKIVGGWKEKA